MENKSEEYIKKLESSLHRQLNSICREYYKKLGLISVLGMLEIVKQETIEFERATSQDIDTEKTMDI